MRDVFIDSTKKEVTNINIDAEKALKEYYKYIDCHCVAGVAIYDSYPHTLYLDDNALLSDAKQNAFEILGQRFIGNGLIVGLDEDEGDDTDSKMTAFYVNQLVTFCERRPEDEARIQFFSFDDLEEIKEAKAN